jgi:DNA topoisomerase-1
MESTGQIPLSPERAIEPALDPLAAARAASLRYINDAMPGITRRRAGTGVAYRDPQGQPIRNRGVLKRIRSLAVPPAWTDVWICPDPNGHIQAVGRDARGRKQYRYHPSWRSVRDEAKYGRMLLFARVLPRIRARVEADLALRGLPRQRVLAALVRLLEVTLARVGNTEYARENKSFGLTTLRNRHARVRGGSVEFDFRGKHGIQHLSRSKIRGSPGLSANARTSRDRTSFSMSTTRDSSRTVGSHDVNDYLRELSGEEITAKDFRTWAGTNLAAIALRELAAAPSEAAAKQNILRAIEAVAKMLGNTPAICRKCYIHPAIFEGYLDGSLLAVLEKSGARSRDDLVGMKAEEAAVTEFLRQRVGEE